jgi:hypothetical protein
MSQAVLEGLRQEATVGKDAGENANLEISKEEAAELAEKAE